VTLRIGVMMLKSKLFPVMENSITGINYILKYYNKKIGILS